jgi:hypothetical protein
MYGAQPRWGCMSPYAGYQPMPYYPAMMGYYPPPQTNFQNTALTQPASASGQNSIRFSANVLPRPSGLTPKDPDAPAEPAVRMRYVELSVTGVEDAADSAKLIATLDKLKGSRGSSVKRKGGGEATVKVWYSDKDPLAADDVIGAVTKLGFKAVLAG